MLIKILCFLIIPSLLGVLPQTLVALTASALFRLPAGGAHCTSYGRCLIGSLFAFTMIGILAKLSGGLGSWTSPVFYITLGLAAVVTLLRVPVDNPCRPMLETRERLRMKKWAWGVLAGYVMVASMLSLSQDMVLAASLGILLQLVTLLPMGYKWMAGLDGFLINLSSITTKEGRWVK